MDTEKVNHHVGEKVGRHEETSPGGGSVIQYVNLKIQ